MFAPSKRKRYTGVIVPKASSEFEGVIVGSNVMSCVACKKFSLWDTN